MTTYSGASAPHSYSQGDSASTKLILIAFMLVLLAFFLAPTAEMAIGFVAPPLDNSKVIETDHATIKHGVEALAIRACIAEFGVHQLWKTRSDKQDKMHKFFRVCQLDTGEWGVQIVKWSWRILGWREVTAYVIRDGRGVSSGQRVVEYLSGIATKVR